MLVSDLYGVGDEFIVQGVGLPSGTYAPDGNPDVFGLGEEMDYSQGLPTPVGDLGQQPTPEQIAKAGGNAALTFGLVTGAVQGGIAYLLLANAKKWQNGWSAVGYIAGGLFALGAVGSVAFGLIGKTVGEAVSTAVPKS